MTNRSATTTGRVNLRSGPGTEHKIIVTLPVNTPLEVLEERGDWLRVNAAGWSGFVHRGFTRFAAAAPAPVAPAPAPKPVTPPPAPAPAPVPTARVSVGAGLELVPLEAPADQLLRVNPKDQLLNRLSATIWNKYGSLLRALSAVLQIEPATAIAVFAVESGGNCFDARTKRMIIRFENQVFFDQWGKANPEVFNRHFTFAATERWKDHKWRPTAGEPFRPADRADFHGDQGREWEVFEFARTLNDRAAKMSISMGAPQVMGFNHATCAYATVEAMFDAFAASERAQVVGFFDFCNASPRRLTAMQTQDFETFAKYYNGTGQAKKYGMLIKTTFDAFRAMQAAAGIA